MEDNNKNKFQTIKFNKFTLLKIFFLMNLKKY